MRTTDLVFSKLKSWWIIWSALAVAACWIYAATANRNALSNGARVDAVSGVAGWIATIGHSLTLAGAVICIWSLARLAAGVRLGLARLRARDLVIVLLVEIVLVLSLAHTVDVLNAAP